MMDESGLQQERVRFQRAPTVTPELNEAVERNKMMEIVSSKTLVFAKNSSAQTASRITCAEMERNHVILGYPLPSAGNISPEPMRLMLACIYRPNTHSPWLELNTDKDSRQKNTAIVVGGRADEFSAGN
jgi:hypothetical protein